MQVDYKQLEIWLHGKLKPLCVADPIPLSQYVIALIKKDKEEQELKEICTDQLEVFLQENTAKFVEDLFTVLKSRAYVVCETLKPVQVSSENSGSKDMHSGKNSLGNNSIDSTSKDRKRHLAYTNASSITDSSAPRQKRKRSLDTRTKRVSSHSRSHSPHSPVRSINNAVVTSRLHGKEFEPHGDSCNRGRHIDHSEECSSKIVDGHNRRKSSGSSNGEATDSNTNSSRRNKYRDSESHKRNSREHIHARDKDEYSIRSSKSFVRSVADCKVIDEKCRDIRNRRCRDFEERGFCVFGDRCQYDHGPNALVISSTKPAASVVTHLTNPLLDTNILPNNTPDSSVNIGREVSKSSALQPQSFVAAVISGQPDLNDLNQQIGTLIPVYHPTPISQPDHQVLMTCCVDQSLDVGLLPQVSNSSIFCNKSNWKHPRLQNNVQRSNSFRTFSNVNTISRNIVPLPMIENFNNGKGQSEINPAPPAYEPDRPHLSMISTSELNALQSRDIFDVEHNASTPPLSYKPSPITEQISSYAVIPKASGVTDLSLDITSRTNDPRAILYIDRLPWKFNDADKIREHFAQFGNVINVIARYRGMVGAAMVEFSSSDEAEKAYRSPIPMFSNRFIRIYTRFPENFKHNARNATNRFPRSKSILDRLGTRPIPMNNNKMNSYSWMSMTHDHVVDQQVPGSIHLEDTLQRGSRSHWRLERNPASGDALLSNDDEDDMIDENPTLDGEQDSASFTRESSKTMNQGMDKIKDTYVDLNVDQESLLYTYNSDGSRHFHNSNNLTVASSPYTLSHKQEAEAILWERRKMAALKQRKEQLLLLDKSREARESIIEARKQRITKLKLLLQRVMSQLDNSRSEEIDCGTDSKPLTLDERRKLLTEAKRLQTELESALEAEKKALNANNKKIILSKPLGSTTISAAALQALPSPVRLERQKQISEIQTEIDKMEASLRDIAQDDVKLKEGRRRIVELKRQLVDLETVRLSDMFMSQNTSVCASGDNSVYPNRTQTKLDKRPRTLYITGIEPDDVENFQSALSLNYLHTQCCTKQTNPETNQLVLEVTFCTRDFAEAAIRQFTQFHGRDLEMSFVHPALSASKTGNLTYDDVKHVSSVFLLSS
ncbi:RNA-binding protein 26 [Schistosoma japonicum]|nr:RNA-binding protein 26 [Schistosoma japonicum]